MAKTKTVQLVEVPEKKSLLEWIRGFWSGPITTNSPEIARLFGGDHRPTAAGIPISAWTALNYSAVWAAVSLISHDVASLPLKLYKRLPTGGKNAFEDHPLYRLLHDAPNPEMSTMDWRATMQGHALIWGNGYSEIERDGGNRPVNLWPITPDRVTPFRRVANAPLQYRVRNASGGETVLDAANVVHLRGLSYDGISGYMVLEKMRESIALAIAAEQFGAEFFGNGSTMGGIISYPSDPPPETKKNNRETLERRHQGVRNAHKFLALYGGAKYEAVTVPPNHAQFQELRTFQIREAARWFKVPPHKLGDLADATFSNVEQQNLDYYTSCLRPWLEVWEQELGRKLIAPLERKQQFIQHVVEDLLRADAAGRGEFYSKRFSVGSLTPNEIRQHENDDPVDGGDELYVPANMIPASLAKDYYQSLIDKNTAAAKPATTPVPPTPDQVNAFIAALEARIAERDGAIESLARDLITEREARTAAETRGDTALRECDGVRAELAGARGEMHEMTAALETAQADRDTARQVAVEATTRADGFAMDLATERDAHAATQASASEQAHGFRLELDTVRQAQQAADAAILAERERVAAADQRATTAEAVNQELRNTNLLLTTAVSEAQAVALEAREALVKMTAERDQADAAAAEVLTRIEAVSGDLAQRDARLATVAATLKPVITETFTRLLTREADRARKAYGTPDKLLKWASDFYPMHADSMRSALKTVLRPWLALHEAPLLLDQVLEDAVSAYIEESQRQLRGLAMEHTPETLAPAIETLLRRWERDRAEAMTETICRKGAA